MPKTLLLKKKKNTKDRIFKALKGVIHFLTVKKASFKCLNSERNWLRVGTFPINILKDKYMLSIHILKIAFTNIKLRPCIDKRIN